MVRSPVLIVALLAVAVLMAALIAPLLIDWNGYRSGFERRITDSVGREATIAGPITVRLLPAPRIRFTDVRIANPPGAAEPYLLTVRRITARFALAPMLSRRIVVNKIRLVGPVVEAEVLASGERSWRLAGAGTTIDARNISLDRTIIEDGSLRFRDGRTGVRLDVEAIAGVLSAAALSGPLRFSGHGVANGIGGELAVDLGRADANGARRLSLRASPDDPGRPHLAIDVTLADHGDSSGYSGKLALERSAADPVGEARRRRAAAAPGVPFRLSARLSGTAEAMRFDDLELGAGGLEPSLRLSGYLHLGLSKTPMIDADLRVDWVDLDALLARQRGWALFEFAAKILRQGPTGKLKLAVTAGNWRSARFGGLRFLARLSSGQMTIERATANLPGGVLASLAGRFDAGTLLDPKIRFDGTMTQSGDDVRKFLRWAAPGHETALRIGRWRAGQRFSITGAIKFDGGQIALSRAKLSVGPARAQGSVKIRLAEPKEVTIKAAASGFDTARFGVEPVIGGGIRPIWRRVRKAANRAFGGLGRTALTLDMTQNRIAGIAVARVGLDAVISHGDIDLTRARVTLGRGAKIALEGVIAGRTATPDGFLDIRIEANERAALDDLVRIAAGDAAVARFAGVLARIGPVRLEGRVTFAAGPKGRMVNAAVSGALGAGKLTAKLDFAGDPATPGNARIDLSLELDHDDAGVLFGLAGSDPAPRPDVALRPGRLRLLLTGTPAKGLKGSVAAEAVGLRGKISGEITGGGEPAIKATVTARAADGRALLAALGIVAPKRGAGPPIPIDLKSGIVGKLTGFSFTGLSGRLGPAAVAANGTVALGGPVPVIRGVANIDVASLPWLFSALVARTRTAAFDLRGLTAFDLALTGGIAKLDLGGGSQMTDATYVLLQHGGVLRLNELEGTVAGGTLKLTGFARQRGGALALQADAKLTGGRLEELISGARGSTPLRGRVGFETKFQTRARTGPGLRVALTGKARLWIADGVLASVDPKLLAEELTAAPDETARSEVLQNLPDTGAFRFKPVTFDISVADGMLRASLAEIDGDGATARVESLFDLAAGKLDSEWRLTLAGLSGAPPLTVVIAGPLNAVRQTFDTRDLRAWATVRSLRRQIDRLNRRRPDTAMPAPGITN